MPDLGHLPNVKLRAAKALGHKAVDESSSSDNLQGFKEPAIFPVVAEVQSITANLFDVVENPIAREFGDALTPFEDVAGRGRLARSLDGRLEFTAIGMLRCRLHAAG